MEMPSRKQDSQEYTFRKDVSNKFASLGLSGVLMILFLFLGGGYVLFRAVRKIPDFTAFINSSGMTADEDPFCKSGINTDFVVYNPKVSIRTQVADSRTFENDEGQEISASFVSYEPKAKPNGKPPRKQPTEENAIQEATSASGPSSPVIIVNSPNAVPMPIATSMADLDVDLSPDLGIGDGLGGMDSYSSYNSAELGESVFGLGLEGASLSGTLYDLKKKRNGAPSGVTPEDKLGVVDALAVFFKNWNESELYKYYSNGTRRYASHWYLPVARAKCGPIVYDVGNPEENVEKWDCKPAAWVAVYRGRVTAPRSGKFRFIGTGDDFLAVRFDKKTVLEAGYCIPSLYDKANPTACFISEPSNRKTFLKTRENKGYEMISSIRGCEKWNRELGGLVAGEVFSVKKGEAYDIEIAVADISGDTVGFVLCIEDVTFRKNSNAEKYELFCTCRPYDIDNVMYALSEADCSWPGGTSRIYIDEPSWVWQCVSSQ